MVQLAGRMEKNQFSEKDSMMTVKCGSSAKPMTTSITPQIPVVCRSVACASAPPVWPRASIS